MPDVCEAQDILLSPHGLDFGMLTQEEREHNNYSRLTYTELDKRVMRQYEGAAAPAKRLSKVTQERRNIWSYMLFEVKLTLQDTSQPHFHTH